jgi:drug/metabolite transporter (DMT)-like permease
MGGRVRLERSEWIPLAIAAFFNMTVWHVMSAFGLTMIGAGHAAVVCYTLPAWTAVLSVMFLGDKLDARVILSLVCGMGGVAVLASHNFDAIGSKPLGLVLVLIASVSWAIGTILIKRRAWSIGVSALAGWQLLLGMVPISVMAVTTERLTMHQASTAAIFAGLYTFVFGLIVGYALWFKVVDSFPATIAAIGALVIPVVGMMSSALLLNEPLGWREFAALGLVLAAVALVVFRRAAPKPSGG